MTETRNPEDKSDRPAIRTFEKEALAFAEKWRNWFSDLGTLNIAKVNQFAHHAGKAFGLTAQACGRLTLSIAPFFENCKDIQKTLFRVGLFMYSNRNALMQEKSVEEIRGSCSQGFWAVICVTALMEAERSKKGRKRWNVVFLVTSGPMAGCDMSTIIADSYLAGIVRSISGARYSKTVSGVDIFAMKLKAHIIPGVNGMTIQEVDDKWENGRKFNTYLRKTREECPYGPCERCRNPQQYRCNFRIEITPKKEENKNGNNGS